jgi:prepilin-type N-terminal cleavage/methylation domain-containing protein
MKSLLPIANCRLPIKFGSAAARPPSIGNRKSKIENGFTMVEIAICLAIIGIALVAIIGVLPLGINVQKDNREETLVDQDATVFIENVRNGARGLDDLTNYVYAITNVVTTFNSSGQPLTPPNVYGYAYNGSTLNGAPMTPPFPLTNGMNIIGLLSTPEYTDLNFYPTNNLFSGGYSNHVVAYVRSLSGPAVEKPPQNNPIVLGDAFGYKMICNNVPVAVNTPPLWRRAQLYKAGDEVFWYGFSWRATAATTGDIPGLSPLWAEDSYSQQLTANLHELRLTFLWPLLPNGNTGNGRHTFATTVAGQIAQTNVNSQWLYFFQPQSFTSAP